MELVSNIIEGQEIHCALLNRLSISWPILSAYIFLYCNFSTLKCHVSLPLTWYHYHCYYPFPCLITAVMSCIKCEGVPNDKEHRITDGVI